MKTSLSALKMVGSSKLEKRLATQLGALERQQILTGIKSLHKTSHYGKICHDDGNNVETWGINKHINIACISKFVKWESNDKNNLEERTH